MLAALKFTPGGRSKSTELISKQTKDQGLFLGKTKVFHRKTKVLFKLRQTYTSKLSFSMKNNRHKYQHISIKL